MSNKAKIFSELERIAPAIPAPVFWMDNNGIGLGCNDLVLQAIGATGSRELLIGKTPDEYLPKDTADIVLRHINQVVQEKRAITFEESIKDLETGKTKYLLMSRAPLFGDNGIDVVGTIVSAAEITDRKEKERLEIETELQKAKIEEQLKFKKLVDQAAQDTKSNLAVLLVIAQQCMGLTKKEVFATIEKFAVNVPISLYWFDENNIILGANKQDVELIGVTSVTDYIGKTPYDFFPFETADKAVKHNNLVMQTGKILSQEETIKDITTGEIKYCLAFKAPLYSRDGKNIGILCTSVDITAEKNAERLKLENALQKTELDQASKIHKITSSVVHDITSPLTSLKMLTEKLENVDEETRTIIRNATSRINDIINNLAIKYGKSGEVDDSSANKLVPEIISCLTDSLLSEKRAQYIDYNISFELNVTDEAQGLFAKVNSERFKRIISNIINNAVEAIAKTGKSPGCINVQVFKAEDLICIQVKDNGCGFPKKILAKIGIDKVSTKAEGDHGIGLFTAIQQFKEWGGDYSIDSKASVGVTFTIKLPITRTPEWFQEGLELKPNTQIVVLDDDASIHNVWETRFKPYLNHVSLHHFTNSKLLLESLAVLQINPNVLYLIDYELLGSPNNGIEVIRKLGTMEGVFLVTSRYEDQKLRKECEKLGITIIPKSYAPYIPIELKVPHKLKVAKEAGMISKAKAVTKFSQPDYVLIDDDRSLLMSWEMLAKDMGVKLLTFFGIEEFERVKDKLHKDIPIYVDYCLGNDSGIEYTKQLAEEGFTNLYLATGYSKQEFADKPMPWLKDIVGKMVPFASNNKTDN